MPMKGAEISTFEGTEISTFWLLLLTTTVVRKAYWRFRSTFLAHEGDRNIHIEGTEISTFWLLLLTTTVV